MSREMNIFGILAQCCCTLSKNFEGKSAVEGGTGEMRMEDWSSLPLASPHRPQTGTLPGGPHTLKMLHVTIFDRRAHGKGFGRSELAREDWLPILPLCFLPLAWTPYRGTPV